MSKKIHTISFLVANKPGVLVRVALVFAKRGYNIDSLVVSPSFNEKYSRMTIAAQGDLATLDQIIKQAGKLIDVLNVSEHPPENAIEKEFALLKIRCKPQQKAALQKILKEYKAHILDSTNGAVIIEHVGTTVKLNELEITLKKYGLIEMVRTGKVLMVRGKETT
ncbi:MAG: acetolactate synthase small subunit [Candidatus Omnitrophica bacterium]|nr:acetolactate synthase small subunit [Candidatus Omnitrophota bacterium]